VRCQYLSASVEFKGQVCQLRIQSVIPHLRTYLAVDAVHGRDKGDGNEGDYPADDDCHYRLDKANGGFCSVVGINSIGFGNRAKGRINVSRLFANRNHLDHERQEKLAMGHWSGKPFATDELLFYLVKRFGDNFVTGALSDQRYYLW
jgi:hypothetical protein